MKKVSSLTYESAFAELKLILADLQEGTTGIDELTARVERANELVQFCRERLRQTETAIQQLIPPPPAV